LNLLKKQGFLSDPLHGYSPQRLSRSWSEMLKKQPILVFLLILLLTALACNFPSRQSVSAPTPDGPEATLTAVAETLQAILTQTAAAAKETDVPTPVPALPTQPSLPTAVLPTAAPPVASTLPPASTPVPPTPIPCDLAQFFSDVTIPDDTTFVPGSPFTKTWRIKNTGSCTWTTAYSVVFTSGDQMGAPNSVNLPHNVGPGQTVDISVPMTAPASNGTYKGNWKLRNASGYVFGLGQSSTAFWVQIKVFTVTPSGPVVVYSFYDHACSARWNSEAGILPCPGTNTDNAGFVLKLSNPKLETGSLAGVDVIQTHPMWENHALWNGNGWIQGVFPPVNIKAGYRLRAQIGCLDGALSCDVNFYIKYSVDGGAWANLSPVSGWNETYDNSLRTIDIDLNSWSGSSVDFLFQVDANSNGGQDWAVWINPRIEK
jgi:hypothetical protein